MNHILLLILLLFCSFASAFESTGLDLSSVRSGVKVYKNYIGVPDKQGVFEQIKLALPAFKRAEYYRGSWWPYGGNCVEGELLSAKSQEGGIYAILELESGEYLSLLPLCGDQAYAWFAPQEGKLFLRFGHKGTKRVQGDMPIIAWATGQSPYEASYEVWKMASLTAQIKGNMKLRDEKVYPEMFKYLGWCSWEEYRRNINETLLKGTFKELEKSELPVRYMLVDGGHLNFSNLKPDSKKFPNGYEGLINLRNEEGIKWVGMWHGLLGTSSALPLGEPKEIRDDMMIVQAKRSMAKPNEKSIRVFMEYLTAYSKRAGADFIKVDFCGTLLPFAAGSKGGVPAKFPKTNKNAIPNPSEYAAMYSRIYQEHAEKEFDGLLNCNWHIPHFIFNSGENNVGRSGPDYKLTVKRARECIYNSFSTVPWLGQVAWGDHDMFHSTDKLAARMMAVSKALSGGPVYLSDNPKHMNPDVVWPLVYQDGLLLRPLAPGAPLPEDIFVNNNEKKIYRTMAPLANKSVAIACYNLQGNGKTAEPTMTTRLLAKHYQAASGMIQPYKGEWALPKEGLVVFDQQNQTAKKMEKGGYEVSISGFKEQLFQLSPITKGWSVIGRTDKYLSAAAVKVKDVSSSQIKLELVEQGPFAIWLAEGQPVAKGVKFEAKGHGLFVAQLPIKAKALELTVSKK